MQTEAALAQAGSPEKDFLNILIITLSTNHCIGQVDIYMSMFSKTCWYWQNHCIDWNLYFGWPQKDLTKDRTGVKSSQSL